MTSIDDPKIGAITQIAALVTDKKYKVLAQLPTISIHHSDDILEKASDWVKQNLPESIQESRVSPFSIAQVEEKFIHFLAPYKEQGSDLVLAGDCPATDRDFLREHMKKLFALFHYELFDVASIKKFLTNSSTGQQANEIDTVIEKFIFAEGKKHDPFYDSIHALNTVRFLTKICQFPQIPHESNLIVFAGDVVKMTFFERKELQKTGSFHWHHTKS